jgi:hypothetical protein
VLTASTTIYNGRTVGAGTLKRAFNNVVVVKAVCAIPVVAIRL